MSCPAPHDQAIVDEQAESSAVGRRSGVVARVLLGGVRFYQRRISILFGPRCRYYPTCSSYAVTAIEKHGAVKGAGLAAWRLVRCNPLSPGGIDDVPEPSTRSRRS